MTYPRVTVVEPGQVSWPRPASVPSAVDGAPDLQAWTSVVEDHNDHQLGLWRVTEGRFESDHAGYVEYFHVIEGRGQLVSEGSVSELVPGVSVLVPKDWKGRWVVEAPVTKSFCILRDVEERA